MVDAGQGADGAIAHGKNGMEVVIMRLYNKYSDRKLQVRDVREGTPLKKVHNVEVMSLLSADRHTRQSVTNESREEKAFVTDPIRLAKCLWSTSIDRSQP